MSRMIRTFLFLTIVSLTLPCWSGLTLQEAEEIALCQNKNLLKTEQLLQKVKEERAESFSKWMPELTAMSQAFTLQKSQPIIVEKNSAFGTELSLTQALFSSKLYYGVKLSKLMLEKMCILLQAARNDVLYQVRRAYYQLLLDQTQIATAKERVELLNALAQQMSDRYKVGTATPYEVNQSKVLSANANTFYLQAVRQLKTDRDVFMQLLGMDPSVCKMVEPEGCEIDLGQFPELIGRMRRLSLVLEEQSNTYAPIFNQGYLQQERQEMAQIYTSQEIDYWLRVADQFSPYMKGASTDVQIAKKEVANKIGEYFPVLQGMVNYGSMPCDYEMFPSTRFNNQNFYFGAGIQLTWMLFDGLGRERRISQAKHQQRAQEWQQLQVVQQIHSDILDSIYTIEEAMAEVVNAHASTDLAQQTIEQASQQLKIGYITIFDYQIAVDTLFQAKNQYNQACFHLLDAYFGLKHVSGIETLR